MDGTVGKPERLAQWNNLAPGELSVTADGKHLSFLKSRTWQDVYVGELGPGGGTMKLPRRLTLDNRGIQSLDSSTLDGQGILYSSARNGRAEVFRQDLKESVGETLVQGPLDNYNSALSPDGSWMLYVEPQ